MCPEPIQKATLRLKALTPGAVLKILVTDPAAEVDFEAWCGQHKHIYLGCSELARWREIHIRKQAG
jgi:tRNA 2-thiouridine synthesizing protein A